MASTRVAVIGAGAAGLLAAARARALGAEVILLEEATRPGGVIETTRQGEWLMERGPNTLAEPHPEVRALLDAVDLPEFIIRPGPDARRRYLVHQGKPVALPSRVSDLVASPLLTLSGRLRLLKEPFIERGPENPEETVDAFVRRRLGAEAADRIIDPYLAGTSGGDPKQLLARSVLPRLVEYERTGGSILKGAMRSRRNARRGRTASGGIWSCRDGLGSLMHRLAVMHGPDLHLVTSAQRIARQADSFEIGTASGSFSVDRVVIAVPAPALTRITWNGIDASGLQSTAAIPQGSMAVVSLGFRRADVGHPLDGFGMLAASLEKRRILGTLFTSSIFQGRAPADHVLLTSFVGGGRRPDLMRCADAELFALVREELHELLDARGEPVVQDLVRWHDAMPQTVAGHGERLAAAAAVEERTPGLAFAGAWRDGLAVGEAMLSGLRAADRVLGYAASTPDGAVS